MKHHEYPAVLILSITLVLFFFVIFISSVELPEKNVSGLAVEQSQELTCVLEDYCLEWDSYSIKRNICVEPSFSSSNICLAYDYQMNCVEWDYNIIQGCDQWTSETVWEEDCLEWGKKEVCE